MISYPSTESKYSRESSPGIIGNQEADFNFQSFQHRQLEHFRFANTNLKPGSSLIYESCRLLKYKGIVSTQWV